MITNRTSRYDIDVVNTPPIGVPTIIVMQCASKIPLNLTESSSPPSPILTNIIARNIPAKIASILPTILPGESWSKKKMMIPIIVSTTAITSRFLRPRLSINAVIMRMNMGQEYCNTIALAAVVSLLDVTKSIADTLNPNPAPRVALDSLNGTLIYIIYPPSISADMRLRSPAINKGFQDISLINIPPMLHIEAVITMRIIDFCLAVNVIYYFLIL